MIYMYILLTTATLEALQIADPVPVHGLESASCQPENERCTGISNGQADFQCCSEYCHIYTSDFDTGRMFGLCETWSDSCRKYGQPCTGTSQLLADEKCCSSHCHVTSVDGATGQMKGLCEPMCKLEGQSCSGDSWYQASQDCCSGNCNPVSVDKEGTHSGTCATARECQLNGDICTGATYSEADAKCCSGRCNVYAYDKEGHFGTCIPKATMLEQVGEEKAVEHVGEEKTIEDQQNAPGSCRKNDRPCFGSSQDLADAQCCSSYCHVMFVDGATGQMKGLCQPDCKLRGQSCSGKSQYKADAKCCSGSCNVLSVDERGDLYGTCERATPVCKPITAACSGKYINDADAQCCSGNCGNLVSLNGEFHGRCTVNPGAPILFVEDGQPKLKQPAIQSPQNSAGEA